MTNDELDLQAGQVWRHRDHGYEVQTTKRVEGSILYEHIGGTSDEQADAVQDFLATEFGFSLVTVAKVKGSRSDVDDFRATFEYVRKRQRAPYENF